MIKCNPIRSLLGASFLFAANAFAQPFKIERSLWKSELIDWECAWSMCFDVGCRTCSTRDSLTVFSAGLMKEDEIQSIHGKYEKMGAGTKVTIRLYRAALVAALPKSGFVYEKGALKDNCTILYHGKFLRLYANNTPEKTHYYIQLGDNPAYELVAVEVADRHDNRQRIEHFRRELKLINKKMGLQTYNSLVDNLNVDPMEWVHYVAFMDRVAGKLAKRTARLDLSHFYYKSYLSMDAGCHLTRSSAQLVAGYQPVTERNFSISVSYGRFFPILKWQGIWSVQPEVRLSGQRFVKWQYQADQVTVADAAPASMINASVLGLVTFDPSATNWRTWEFSAGAQVSCRLHDGQTWRRQDLLKVDPSQPLIRRWGISPHFRVSWNRRKAMPLQLGFIHEPKVFYLAGHQLNYTSIYLGVRGLDFLFGHH